MICNICEYFLYNYVTKTKMKKMETYLIIALIGIVLFGIGAIGMRMNMSTISEEKKYKDRITTDTLIIGIKTLPSVKSGAENIIIGAKSLNNIDYKRYWGGWFLETQLCDMAKILR